MKSWIVRILIPFWISFYIVAFRMFSGVLFLSLIVYFGAWMAALVLVVIYGLWGTIFYLVLLETDSIETVREKISILLDKKPGKMKNWLKSKFFMPGVPVQLSPLLIVLTFIIESPLLGAFVIRLGYPKQYRLKGLLWVWIGALAEVVTWFLPIYVGGSTLLNALFLTG